jgi:hypothetical protein
MRIHTGIRSVGHLNSCFGSLAEVLPLRPPHELFLFDDLLRVAHPLELSDDVIVVVNVGHQPGPAFLHQRDPLVIDETPVLD